MVLLAALPREASHPQQAEWPDPPCCRDAAGHASILAGGHTCHSSLDAGGHSLLRMRGGGHTDKKRGGVPKDSGKGGAAASDADPSGGSEKRSRRAFPTGHKSVNKPLRPGRKQDDDSSDEPKPAPKRRSKLAGLKGILQAKIKGEPPPPTPPMRKKPRVPRDASTMPDAEEGEPEGGQGGWGEKQKGKKKVRQGSFEALGLSAELEKGMHHAGAILSHRTY